MPSPWQPATRGTIWCSTSWAPITVWAVTPVPHPPQFSSVTSLVPGPSAYPSRAPIGGSASWKPAPIAGKWGQGPTGWVPPETLRQGLWAQLLPLLPPKLAEPSPHTWELWRGGQQPRELQFLWSEIRVGVGLLADRAPIAHLLPNGAQPHAISSDARALEQNPQRSGLGLHCRDVFVGTKLSSPAYRTARHCVLVTQA